MSIHNIICLCCIKIRYSILNPTFLIWIIIYLCQGAAASAGIWLAFLFHHSLWPINSQCRGTVPYVTSLSPAHWCRHWRELYPTGDRKLQHPPPQINKPVAILDVSSSQPQMVLWLVPEQHPGYDAYRFHRWVYISFSPSGDGSIINFLDVANGSHTSAHRWCYPRNTKAHNADYVSEGEGTV